MKDVQNTQSVQLFRGPRDSREILRLWVDCHLRISSNLLEVRKWPTSEGSGLIHPTQRTQPNLRRHRHIHLERRRYSTGARSLTSGGLHKVPHFYSGNGRANFDDLTNSGRAHDRTNLDRRNIGSGGPEPSTHGRIERDIVDSDNDLVLLKFGDEVAGGDLDGLECCGLNCSGGPLVKDDLLNSLRD